MFLDSLCSYKDIVVIDYIILEVNSNTVDFLDMGFNFYRHFRQNSVNQLFGCCFSLVKFVL